MADTWHLAKKVYRDIKDARVREEKARELMESTRSSERRIGMLEFQTKQYQAQINKLTGGIGDGRKTEERQSWETRKKPASHRVEVKDVNAYDRSKIDVGRAAVQIHNAEPSSLPCLETHKDTKELIQKLQGEISRLRSQLSTITEGIVREEESLPRASSSVSGYGSFNESDVRKLKEKISSLTQENFRLYSRLADISGERDQDYDQYGRNSKEKTHSMEAEIETLKRQLHSKNTNLLRCEDKLRKVQEEKDKLSSDLAKALQEVQRYREQAEADSVRIRPEPSFSSPVNRIVRSKSDNVLTTPRTGNGGGAASKGGPLSRSRRRSLSSSPERRGRSPGVNRYCEVCRQYRDKLMSQYERRRDFRGSVAGRDSTLKMSATNVTGRKLGDEEASEAVIDKLIDENLQLRDSCREAKAQCDKLQREQEILRKSNDELKHENADLKRQQSRIRDSENQLSKNPQRTMSALPSTSDQLVDHYKALLAKVEAEKSRHEANYALIHGQKIKLEFDLKRVEDRCANLTKVNLSMSRKLVAAEDHIRELEKKLKLPKDTSTQPSESAQRFRELEEKLSALSTKLSSKEAEVQRLRLFLEKAERLPSASPEKNEQSLSEIQLERRSIRQYEELLKKKDSIITSLKATLVEMDEEFRTFRKNLGLQENNLVRLHEDLQNALTAKIEATKRCKLLEEDRSQLQSQFKLLYGDYQALEEQFRNSVEEKEKLQQSLKLYLDDVRAHEEMLQTKRDNREGVQSEQAEGPSGEVNNLRSEVEMLRKDKKNLLEDLRMQQNQFAKSDQSLRKLLDQLAASSQQNLSLRNDIAVLRKTVISLDADKLNMIQKISEIESELARAKLNVDNLTLELEMAKAVPRSASEVVVAGRPRQPLQQIPEETGFPKEEDQNLVSPQKSPPTDEEGSSSKSVTAPLFKPP